jgi:hypothetical protein
MSRCPGVAIVDIVLRSEPLEVVEAAVDAE